MISATNSENKTERQNASTEKIYIGLRKWRNSND